MRSCLFLLLICFNFFTAIGQKAAPEFESRKKAVYLEFLGNGTLFSANYDVRLQKGRQDGHRFRAGIGGLPVNGTDGMGQKVSASIITMTLGYNYLVGQRRSAFEMWAGITPIFVSGDVTEIDGSSYSGSGADLDGFLAAELEKRLSCTSAMILNCQLGAKPRFLLNPNSIKLAYLYLEIERYSSCLS